MSNSLGRAIEFGVKLFFVQKLTHNMSRVLLGPEQVQEKDTSAAYEKCNGTLSALTTSKNCCRIFQHENFIKCTLG